ncbi:Txe/YoeB family addiction module toxin, partial [bacterium LRH843]|nr:Txe/YoeB family addiction module toxin [bacterium LRH843]
HYNALLTLDVRNSVRLKNSPPYEKLVGELAGAYSRRINIQRRMIYQIYKKSKTIKIIRLWTHYE